MHSSYLPEGVYYARESYAGFWRRLVVEVVDISLMLAISVGVTLLITSVLPLSEGLIMVLFGLWAILWFSYFVLLKGSRFGTIGYKSCKLRIVNLKGGRPGILSLTLRLIFALFGPLNIIFDLIWLSGDSNRQALRDKFAKTYVVNKDAIPIGTGKLTYKNYGLFGWNMIFCEVNRTSVPPLTQESEQA